MVERGDNMARVTCGSCKTSFLYSVIKGMEVCPVCGKPLWDDTEDTEKVDNADTDMQNAEDNSDETTKVKTKWYYYKEGGGGLDDTLYTHITPLYTFEAVDMEDAKRQLKEVMPNNSLVTDNSPDKVKCPYCFSSEVQIVPRKYSLLTGFATNKFDRVCIRCKRKF